MKYTVDAVEPVHAMIRTKVYDPLGIPMSYIDTLGVPAIRVANLYYDGITIWCPLPVDSPEFAQLVGDGAIPLELFGGYMLQLQL